MSVKHKSTQISLDYRKLSLKGTVFIRTAYGATKFVELKDVEPNLLTKSSGYDPKNVIQADLVFGEDISIFFFDSRTLHLIPDVYYISSEHTPKILTDKYFYYLIHEPSVNLSEFIIEIFQFIKGIDFACDFIQSDTLTRRKKPKLNFS